MDDDDYFTVVLGVFNVIHVGIAYVAWVNYREHRDFLAGAYTALCVGLFLQTLSYGDSDLPDQVFMLSFICFGIGVLGAIAIAFACCECGDKLNRGARGS